ALRDAAAGVRQAAAAALGAIGDAQAVPALSAALHDRDEDVRRAAVKALGRIGDPQAAPALIAALRNRDEDVRRVAAEALTSLLPRLRSAPPARHLQRRLPAIRRASLRLKHPDLLRAALLVDETWKVQRDPWRDPLEPPPVWHGWRWVQRIGAAALAALALIVVALLGVAQEALAQVLAGLAAHPALLLAALVALALAGGLIGWLAERLRGR
ncbi:MAG: HEAT repeat domain-containing protein, partial [Roseiflexus sp.]|nr:HEAT repeat domain-containing protein [Roseiflexus sp.]